METNNDKLMLQLCEATFNKFIREHINISSYSDRNYFFGLNESEKFNVSDKLVAAMYKSAAEKYSMIDFGDIPESKGDIDRIKKIDEIEETIKTIEEIMNKTNSGTTLNEIETVKKSMSVLRSYKREFSTGFIQDKAMAIMTYNSIVLSIYAQLDYCMKVVIDYITTPNATIDNSRKSFSNSQTDVIVDNLNKFNTSANNGELSKFFDSVLTKDNFIGTIGLASVSGVAIGAAVLVAAITIIPITRELIYFLYNLRMNISDFFNRQANFLEINVAELRSGSGNINNRAKVIKNQERKIAQFRRTADRFEVNFNKANAKTKKELQQKISTDTLKASVNSIDDSNGFGLL